jgi:tetratricopeptide (TPR) repeat protein
MEARFRAGERRFHEERYAEAVLVLRDFRNDFPTNRWSVAALYYQGASLLRLGKTEEAVALLQEGLDRYPSSRYRPLLLLELGSSLVRSSDRASVQRGVLLLKELSGLHLEESDPRIAGMALYWKGEGLFALGNGAEARLSWEETRRLFPGSTASFLAGYRLDQLAGQFGLGAPVVYRTNYVTDPRLSGEYGRKVEELSRREHNLIVLERTLQEAMKANRVLHEKLLRSQASVDAATGAEAPEGEEAP